jgi:hypothetical protein
MREAAGITPAFDRAEFDQKQLPASSSDAAPGPRRKAKVAASRRERVIRGLPRKRKRCWTRPPLWWRARDGENENVYIQVLSLDGGVSAS